MSSPLHSIGNFNSHISGEVTIDPSAAIASGVVLHADPNSKIIIAAGACIGMGVVLHAHDGILEIETGANLGAGVLVVGKGRIGANACIGAATTIFNCSIAPKQLIAPGSLLGDTSRHLAATPELPSSVVAETQPSLPTTEFESELSQKQLSPESTQPAGERVVYGKASVTRLMATLFPHSQSLDRPSLDGSPPSQGT